MSEYQYYEFQTIDRPLTAEQQAAVRKLSSRVELSATRAAFNYSYGGFRGEPLKVLEQHFDALLYIANWGSKQLAFRLPRGTIAAEQLEPYLLGDEESYVGDLHTTPQHLILNLEIREHEGYGWIEGEGLLDPLIPLREAILRGDLRALYLFWLRCAEERAGWIDEEEEDEQREPLIEPPVPPGLGQLDPALLAFAEFFAINQDLIAAAAEASPDLRETDEPLERWVTLLPEAERSAYLLRVARGESHVGIELLRRLREVGGAGKPITSTAPRRTFAELQAAAQRQEQRRIQREREEAERARLAKLANLAQREAEIWASIPTLLGKRTASGYDEGVALLAELRELAVHQGQLAAFDARLRELTAPYAGSSALQRRLREKQLG
ncbi:MAG: hypothetical protein HXY37_01460 [Chloroflexi bacterium]|nr:hypothetical protein [Chloroflexota bacterium]